MLFKQPFRMFYEMARLLAQGFSKTGCNRDVMNVMDIKNRWNEVRALLKRRYQMLTDEDLTLCLGKEGDLITRLQHKLGKTKADILKIIGEA
jgi:hypothetical protein